MKRILVALSIVVITAILSSQFIFSQETGIPEKMKQHRIEIWDNLNLTDAQKIQISELELEHRKDMINLEAGLKLAELEMAELKSSGNYTRDEVLSVVKKINDRELDLRLARENHLYDIYEILTPEQKDEMNRALLKVQKFKQNFGKGGHIGYRNFRNRF